MEISNGNLTEIGDKVYYVFRYFFYIQKDEVYIDEIKTLYEKDLVFLKNIGINNLSELSNFHNDLLYVLFKPFSNYSNDHIKEINSFSKNYLFLKSVEYPICYNIKKTVSNIENGNYLVYNYFYKPFLHNSSSINIEELLNADNYIEKKRSEYYKENDINIVDDSNNDSNDGNNDASLEKMDKNLFVKFI